MIVLKAHYGVGFLKIVFHKIADARGDLFASPFDCHAVQIASRTGRSGRSIGHFCGICCRDFDLLHINAKFKSGHLGKFLKQTLAHLGSAMIDSDAAILVEMHQSARLIKVT